MSQDMVTVCESYSQNDWYLRHLRSRLRRAQSEDQPHSHVIYSSNTNSTTSLTQPQSTTFQNNSHNFTNFSSNYSPTDSASYYYSQMPISNMPNAPPPPVPKKTVVHVYPMRSQHAQQAQQVTLAASPGHNQKFDTAASIGGQNHRKLDLCRTPTPPPIPPKPEVLGANRRGPPGAPEGPPPVPAKPRLPTPAKRTSPQGKDEVVTDEPDAARRVEGGRLAKAHSIGHVGPLPLSVTCNGGAAGSNRAAGSLSGSVSSLVAACECCGRIGSGQSSLGSSQQHSTSLHSLHSANAHQSQALAHRELEMEKASLIDSLSRKLCILEEEGKALAKDIQANELVASQLLTRIRENRSADYANELLDAGIARLERFLAESGRVTSLRLKLKAQTARAEHALASLPPEADCKEKALLQERRRRLDAQEQDAEALLICMEQRKTELEEWLRTDALDDESGALEFQAFLDMQNRLLEDSAQLQDKIRRGEEQIRALRSL